MLTVSQLSKSFAGRALFDDVSLQVNRGDRIELIVPNGLANQPCSRSSSAATARDLKRCWHH
jgi:ABC-type lipopolysaccharide export system ATPase subunit